MLCPLGIVDATDAGILLDQRSHQPSSREPVLSTRTEGISLVYLWYQAVLLTSDTSATTRWYHPVLVDKPVLAWMPANRDSRLWSLTVTTAAARSISARRRSGGVSTSMARACAVKVYGTPLSWWVNMATSAGAVAKRAWR